jgi:hypothetical protein
VWDGAVDEDEVGVECFAACRVFEFGNILAATDSLVFFPYFIEFGGGVVVTEVDDTQIGVVLLEEVEQLELSLDDCVGLTVYQLLLGGSVEVLEAVLTAELL